MRLMTFRSSTSRAEQGRKRTARTWSSMYKVPLIMYSMPAAPLDICRQRCRNWHCAQHRDEQSF